MKTMKQPRRRPAMYTALHVAIVSIQAITIHAWTPHSFLGRPILIRSNNAIDTHHAQQSQRHAGSAVFSSTKSSSESDIAEDEDWREFRAHLVRSENDNDVDSSSTKRNSSPDRRNDEDHWAYETGDFVERGSIVISVPSSNEFLNDVDALNNICYRKSIVLVLDVGPNFIQGIVLNRPTNIGVKEGMQFVQPGHGEVFEDEMGSCLGDNCDIDEDGAPTRSARWKVWFGGEVGGPYSDYPQVVCLHSVATDSAMAVSDRVLPGIFLTSFGGAERIVQAGDANPSDFWIFSGICGWETSTFYQEMHEEGLWHVVSADSETILEELNMLRCEEEEDLAVTQICDIDHDPRNAGLHTWEMLMENIGLEKKAHESEDSFGDLMLHEWATGALSFSIKEEQTSMIVEPFLDTTFSEDDDTDFDLSNYDPASAMSIESVSSNRRQSTPGIVGVMVRASSARRSPYLLSDQGFHKSLILILRDGDDYSEGIILNHMTSRSLRLDLGFKTIDLPIRYGGPTYYSVEDDADDDDDDGYEIEVPTVFLHSNGVLGDAGVGNPIGKSRLFECTKEEVIKVLKSGMASANDIMVVQGISVWTKKGEHTGILGDVEAGFFELVPRPKSKQVWDTLLLQEQLTADNLSVNASKSQLAWNAASRYDEDTGDTDNSSGKEEIHVFGTDVDVTMLADEAAIRWIKVNLL